jgi:hypothetical protein
MLETDALVFLFPPSYSLDKFSLEGTLHDNHEDQVQR